MSTKVTGRVKSLSPEQLNKIEFHNSNLSKLFLNVSSFDEDIETAMENLMCLRDFIETAPHCMLSRSIFTLSIHHSCYKFSF